MESGAYRERNYVFHYSPAQTPVELSVSFIPEIEMKTVNGVIKNLAIENKPYRP